MTTTRPSGSWRTCWPAATTTPPAPRPGTRGGFVGCSRRTGPRRSPALTQSIQYLRRASPATSLPCLGRWALLATLSGDDDALEEATTAPGSRTARWTRGFLGYATAVHLGRQGRPDEAEAAFATADATMHRPVPMPGFRHSSRRLVAEAALDDGWGRPAQWLREDLVYFEETGAAKVAAACRKLLRVAGVPVPRRTPGPDVPAELRRIGVTAREMEVLLLVADGLTNREIATRLVLSVRTVDKHVERLLAKTGATSRGTLQSVVTRAPPLSPT